MDNKTELTAFAWEYHLEELENMIMSGRYKLLNLFFHHEFEIDFPSREKIVNYINNKKIKVNAVTISKPPSYNYFLNNINNSLLNLEIWETFWLNRTHNETLLNNRLYKSIHVNKFKFKFKYPFASFNGKSRFYRTILIDKLYEKNLNKVGNITYHQTRTNFDNSYVPKYYNNQRLVINDTYTKNYSSYLFNEIYLDSFMHIPAESSIDTFVFSEKTASPILCKLPFLTIGSVGYHQKLKELGFQMYDEIFDYSFDNEEDVEKRISMIVENIQFVVDNTHKLKKLHNKIKHKLEYNREKALEIISDYNIIPSLIKSHYNRLKKITHVKYEEKELIDISRYFNNFNMPQKDYISSPSQSVYDLWNNFIVEELEKELEEYRPKNLVILGENEWEPWFSDKTLSLIKKYNVNVVYVIGALISNYLKNRIKSYNYNNIDLQCWPTFYFVYAVPLLKQIQPIKVEHFKYSFICMNNRGHEHRCALVDHLEKYKLINSNNVITWHNFLNENMQYNYKYFKHRQIKLDDDFDVKLDSYIIPRQYFESLFDIVSEATHHCIFITEKTVKALYYKKPFIVFGAQGFHKYLKELGFELYDEIFDYSFDNEPDLEKRADLFAKEVKKLEAIKTIEQRDKIRQMLSNKIDNNYKNMLRLISDESYIPEKVKLLMTTINSIDDIHYKNKYSRILTTMRSNLK
jgi:S-adenosylmethionine/arginine decarboxylase-like enzyme